MSADEEGTHAAYSQHLAQVFLPRIEAHRGRIVKSTGDGFVAEFDSVVEGVECALEMQAEIAEQNAGQPNGRTIKYRMGLNLGDIIVEQHDIYGDGVNIAARLQEIAAPGGLCISQTVFEQMRMRPSLRFEDMGRRRVKNVAEPIKVYGIDPSGTSGGVRPPSVRHLRWAPYAITAGVSIAILAGVGAYYGYKEGIWISGDQRSGREDLPAAPSDRPSIAVLAFQNLSNDQQQRYFAEGIADDITTDLSKIAGLFVVSRRSSFSYQDSGKDARMIARELGVRYLLQGSVRRSGDLVRINTQLIDSQSGLHVWAARHDSRLNEIFAVQDKIAREIVSALSVRLIGTEPAQTRPVGTENVAAYDAYLQGWAYYRRLDSTNHPHAVALFQRAIALDPDYGQAHAALAATYLAIRNNVWTLEKPYSDPLNTAIFVQRHSEELLKLVRRHLAEALERPTSLALRVSSEVLLLERKHDEAIQQIVNAIAFEPNDADNYASLAMALNWSGRPSEALEPIQKAMRLNPQFPDEYLALLGITQFQLRNYERAQSLLENTARRNPRSQLIAVNLLSTYGHLGKLAEAKELLGQIGAVRAQLGYPELTTREVRRVMLYKNGGDLLHLLVGLHRAGVANLLTEQDTENGDDSMHGPKPEPAGGDASR